jgi:hypothetical protein
MKKWLPLAILGAARFTRRLPAEPAPEENEIPAVAPEPA